MRPGLPSVTTCRCGHSMFNHTLTRLSRRRGCTHMDGDGRPCPCVKYEPADEPVEAPTPAEPRLYVLPGPPPRGDDALLVDRHDLWWIPDGDVEWRRTLDGFVTTWANLLGVHGPITLRSRAEVAGAQ